MPYALDSLTWNTLKAVFPCKTEYWDRISHTIVGEKSEKKDFKM